MANEHGEEAVGVVGGADVTHRIPEGSSKYLTFALQDEEYGLEILKVKEILGMMETTAVPRIPACFKGVINLRGKVIPVVDLRLKFGMPEKSYTEESCTIVVEVDSVLLGIIVDTVQEVIDLDRGNIEAPPAFGSDVNTDFILGMGKTGERVTILLDIERVLSTRELHVAEDLIEKVDA